MRGFVAGALVFAIFGMWMNAQIGAPILSNAGPVGILALIGGTTAALVSPMLSRRLRSGRARGGDSGSTTD